MNNVMIVLGFSTHTEVAKEFAPEEYINHFSLDGSPMDAIVLSRPHIGNSEVSYSKINAAISSRSAIEHARLIFAVCYTGSGEYYTVPVKDALGCVLDDALESVFSRLPRVYTGKLLRNEPFLHRPDIKSPAVLAAEEIADSFAAGFCDDNMVKQFATIIQKHISK